jgi:purine-cytosine permease-like protein
MTTTSSRTPDGPAEGSAGEPRPSDSARAELAREVNHDYATGTTGVVPLEARRSLYSFVALWVTLAAGFTFLFLGFQYHDSGYSLPKAVGAGAIGALFYLAYALPAAYLGSRTGQTHALLTRSILGSIGSVLVSLLLIGVAAGWTAFAFNLLATLYDGLFGWGHIVAISVILALLGIANNLFGFAGISAFARYLVAPVMILWILYLVIKGLVDLPSATLTHSPKTAAPLPFLAGIGTAIGTVMWGNEPDTWRYGKPRFTWPVLPYVVALSTGLVLFVAGGWMMAELSGAGQYDFGPAFRYTVEYSLFGALWLGAIVATVLQIAINDGNYYEMVNGGQNLLGQAPGWRRWFTCILMAVVAALFTWRFASLSDGFYTVAGWSAVALPSVTVVMVVDQFILPRLGVQVRAVDAVPAWSRAALANWPGLVSVIVAVLFGAWGLGLLPGQDVAPSSVGLVPVEAWLIAGILYAALATAVARTGSGLALLGHKATKTEGV